MKTEHPEHRNSESAAHTGRSTVGLENFMGGFECRRKAFNVRFFEDDVTVSETRAATPPQRALGEETPEAYHRRKGKKNRCDCLSVAAIGTKLFRISQRLVQ
jgi:hypothetical protein